MEKDGTFIPLEEMTQEQKLDEILTIMRQVSVGMLDMVEQLKDSPIAGMFLHKKKK